MTPASPTIAGHAEPEPFEGNGRAVVSFENVGLSYGTADTSGRQGPSVPVLKDVNFQLNEGSFHFLSGPSGAGKTSLMKMIYLDQSPTEGRIRLFGKPIHPHDRDTQAMLRRQIGIVFQDFRLLPHLNVFDNAALPLFVAGQKPAEFTQDVNELLAWVGLKNHLTSMPDVLSGGEKQRLAIARAVVNRPTLILADEPTGNIDYAMGLRIMRLFLELNRLGATVLIATHDESLIRSTGMPVLELRKGQIVRRDLREDLGSHYGSAIYGRTQAPEPYPEPESSRDTPLAGQPDFDDADFDDTDTAGPDGLDYETDEGEATEAPEQTPKGRKSGKGKAAR